MRTARERVWGIRNKQLCIGKAGIVSREALLEQVDAALAAIDHHTPEAIVTLGGDCHVDFAAIAYLSKKYGDDLAVLWVSDKLNALLQHECIVDILHGKFRCDRDHSV